jgi:hypothetical protein
LTRGEGLVPRLTALTVLVMLLSLVPRLTVLTVLVMLLSLVPRLTVLTVLATPGADLKTTSRASPTIGAYIREKSCTTKRVFLRPSFCFSHQRGP